MKLKPCKYCNVNEPIRNKCTPFLYNLHKWISCKCGFETRIAKNWHEAEQDWNNGCGWRHPDNPERFKKIAVGR